MNFSANKFSILFVLFFSTFASSQTYIKGNAALAPILIFNGALEHKIGEKSTLQADLLISPWNSFAGRKLKIFSVGGEYRFYPNGAFHHWYFGANLSTSVFQITKWNYVNSGKFQKGFNFMLGGTIGYQWKWKDKLNLDLFLTAGHSESFYHGYFEAEPNVRYEDADNWNKSGEFIPYRGGLMISYRIK